MTDYATCILSLLAEIHMGRLILFAAGVAEVPQARGSQE